MGNIYYPIGAPGGPPGPTGPQGVQGTQGVIGPQGTQGLTGPPGPQGNTGVVGPQGSQGVIGNQGVQGSTGSTGPLGPQGPQGNVGSLGPQGVQGTQGVQGATGLQGPGGNGPQGTQGVQGSQGSTGTQGVQGAQGSPGLQGPGGLQGSTGPQGPAGDASTLILAEVNYGAVAGAIGNGQYNLVGGTAAILLGGTTYGSNVLSVPSAGTYVITFRASTQGGGSTVGAASFMTCDVLVGNRSNLSLSGNSPNVGTFQGSTSYNGVSCTLIVQLQAGDQLYPIISGASMSVAQGLNAAQLRVVRVHT